MLGAFEIDEAPDRVCLTVRLSVLARLAPWLPLACLVPLLLADDPAAGLCALVLFGGFCWGGLPFLFARACATPLYRRVRKSIVIARYRKYHAAGGLEIDGEPIPLDELRRVVVGPASSPDEDGVRTATVHVVTRRCAYGLGRFESGAATELATLFRKALPFKGKAPEGATAPADLWAGGFLGYLFGAVHVSGSFVSSLYLAVTRSSSDGGWSPGWLRVAGLVWVPLAAANLWLGHRIMAWLLRGATVDFAYQLGVEPDASGAAPRPSSVDVIAPVAPSIAADTAWGSTPGDPSP